MAELIKVDKALFAQIKKASKRPEKHHLQWLIEKFRASDDEIAELTWEPGSYKNCGSAHSAIQKAIKINGAPIKVVQINYRLYLVKEGAFDE